MALAILEYEGAEAGRHRFRAHIGTNRYFTWSVGNADESDVTEGIKLMATRRHEAPLSGPLAPQAMGRTVIDVPREYFDRENRDVQLLSFRTRRLDGPAASDIVRV